jgi:hypothetical protein
VVYQADGEGETRKNRPVSSPLRRHWPAENEMVIGFIPQSIAHDRRKCHVSPQLKNHDKTTEVSNSV